jgi:hypothetical protein
MTTEQKISKIEALDKNSLTELLENLVTKMGYISPKPNDFGISANLKGPISTEKHGFIFYKDQLAGNVDVSSVIELIEEVQKKYKFSTTVLVSIYHISKGFQETLRAKSAALTVTCLDRDDLIEQIERYIPDYWKHDDMNLLDYEREYCASVLQESELKSLKIFSDKYQKLFNIFIEPKIIFIYEDKETQIPKKKSVTIDNIVKEKKPIILAGEAGMGKSTLLKRIGETIVKNNQDSLKKNLPIFISVTELFSFDYSVEALVTDKLKPFFPDLNLETIFSQYNITLLVDSIDEFDDEHQEDIVKQLSNFYNERKARFILGTRNSEKSLSIESLKGYDTYTIGRFNNQQIEQFIHKFYISQKSRAEKLLDALRENRIIEKLPITPLSLSLISILHEENDLEIPATITDIYDNFNSLLLGRAMVSSKIEFIDISFKERILSLYALELLKRAEHTPMTYDEFIEYFEDYFKSKTIPLKKGTLKEALSHLVENTGIVYLKNNTYVAFNHSSFMEYYAALEVFKHQRTEERLFVDNFFDSNWQNSAVFYAGHSKDMPVFLEAVNEKLKKANQIEDYFAAISGAGYLLQALYQTDNLLRKETIDIALEVNIRALELFIKLSSDDRMLFKSFKLPIIWLMNLIVFFENFNSGTLREPLKLSFADLINKYKDSVETTEGYKALTLALTLSSNRINEEDELEELIFNTPILNDTVLTIISDISLGIITTGSAGEIKKEVKKEFNRLKEPLKYLLETPAAKLRFTDYDSISATKKIRIVTEGKTDAIILEHAFMTLTGGKSPYWKIKPSGNESGSSHEVNKALIAANSLIGDDEIIIGIFDHDEAGLGDFGRLPKNTFAEVDKLTKKHGSANVFALLLPIHEDRKHYLMDDQKYNCFEIEHYFSDDYLSKYDALKSIPLSSSHNIYCIKDSKKTVLATNAVKISDPDFFQNFVPLFEMIDRIAGIQVGYQK